MRRRYMRSRERAATALSAGCVPRRPRAADPRAATAEKGDDRILVGVRDIAALSHYRSEKKFHAEAGEARE